jgi:ACR3 family arsenite efflux pump ArsB
VTGKDIAVAADEQAGQAAKEGPALGMFERWVTVWVALCIIVGIGLGHFFPEPFQAIGGVEVAKVNLPVAGLIWLMIIPMLLKIDLGALLATLVILFGLQGEQIIAQPLVIGLLAVPILIQVYFNVVLAYLANRAFGVDWCVAGPSALIGASNFFELAFATAIALFGFQSGAALATVVGVLVEAPGERPIRSPEDGSLVAMGGGYRGTLAQPDPFIFGRVRDRKLRWRSGRDVIATNVLYSLAVRQADGAN